MNVLVRGMKMPTCCADCDLHNPFSETPYCRRLLQAIPLDGRLENCPLVEVQPHGRLIDADKLRASFKESVEECRAWANEIDNDTMMCARVSQSLGTFVEASLRVKAMPTVIEAEE